MNQNLLPSLQISQTRYQRGQFIEAKASCEEAMEEAQQRADTSQWLEAQRLRIQCLIELDQIGDADCHHEQILKFLDAAPEVCHAATAEYILGLVYFGRGAGAEAQSYFDSAIVKAAQSKNHRTLAYALFVEAILAVSSGKRDFSKASLNLDKIELIGTQESLEDLLISTERLRCFLLTESGRFEEALHLLWKSYEHAKIKGFSLVVASVLAEMSHIHLVQKRPDLARIYAELALCGVNSIEQPRLYRRISQLCPKVEVRNQHDIEVDEENRMVLERKRGSISFGNQHLLLEIALLFLKNPGRRYSKTELIEKIWRQAYDPLIHDNLIYVSIKRLRVLIEPSENPHYLLKDRDGYYFNPQSTVHFKSAEESLC